MHYQKTKRDMTAIDRFLNKVKWRSQVILMFTTFRKLCCYQKSRSDRIVVVCMLLKNFLPLQMRRHSPIIWAKANWTSFDIFTRFYLSTSPSQTRVMELIIINLCFYNGHHAKPIRIHLQAPYHQGNSTRDQGNHNKTMREVRPTVE